MLILQTATVAFTTQPALFDVWHAASGFVAPEATRHPLTLSITSFEPVTRRFNYIRVALLVIPF